MRVGNHRTRHRCHAHAQCAHAIQRQHRTASVSSRNRQRTRIHAHARSLTLRRGAPPRAHTGAYHRTSAGQTRRGPLSAGPRSVPFATRSGTVRRVAALYLSLGSTLVVSSLFSASLRERDPQRPLRPLLSLVSPRNANTRHSARSAPAPRVARPADRVSNARRAIRYSVATHVATRTSVTIRSDIRSEVSNTASLRYHET